jgi:hypothetical protein
MSQHKKMNHGNMIRLIFMAQGRPGVGLHAHGRGP